MLLHFAWFVGGKKGEKENATVIFDTIDNIAVNNSSHALML